MQQIAMPQPPLDIIKAAQDSRLLPLCRPILFVPFLFTMAMLYVMVVIVAFGTLAASWHGGPVGAQQIIALGGAAALSIVTAILAVETITDLTARAEPGKDLDLNAAIAHAVSRLPLTLLTSAVMTAGSWRWERWVSPFHSTLSRWSASSRPGGWGSRGEE